MITTGTGLRLGVKAGRGLTFLIKTMESPVGLLKLIASERGLSAVLWENDPPLRVHRDRLVVDEGSQFLVETERQLKEYFAGTLQKFTVKLDFEGTPFQLKIWQALLSIPYGETRTYGQIASQIGKPTACRAVGAANGKNPISIIAPCHRVIGSNGSLTGFAGGLKIKSYLLELEQRVKSCH